MTFIFWQIPLFWEQSNNLVIICGITIVVCSLCDSILAYLLVSPNVHNAFKPFHTQQRYTWVGWGLPGKCDKRLCCLITKEYVCTNWTRECLALTFFHLIFPLPLWNICINVLIMFSRDNVLNVIHGATYNKLDDWCFLKEWSINGLSRECGKDL